MRSPLTDAGKNDTCPECGIGLKIPGEERLRAEQTAAKKQEEVRKSKLAETGPPREARQTEEKQEPLFVEQPSSELSAAVEPGDSIEGIELGGSFSERDFNEVPPPRFITNTTSAPMPAVPKPKLNPKTSQSWWHDTIRIESVSSSRYPALIAYRNILVLLWWVLTIVTVLVAFAYPAYLIRDVIREGSRINKGIDLSIQAHQSPTIQKVLSAADNNQDYSVSDARSLQLFVESEFPTFPNPIHIGFNDKSVPPEALDDFAKAWRQWSPAELASLNFRRVDSLNTTIVPIAVFWCALILFYVFASISILVIPECIKLAIDIEQGIRER
jgi:hypothetical protein